MALDLKNLVRVVDGFPKAGISFKDITTLLRDQAAYRVLVDALAASLKGKGVDLVIGPEARGFALGAPVAYVLGAGFVLARKPGKLPAAVCEQRYGLEYGSDVLQMHKDAVLPGQRVAVVDDLLATGGTALAACKLAEQMGGSVVGVRFAMELTYLGGRETLRGYDVQSIISYDD